MAAMPAIVTGKVDLATIRSPYGPTRASWSCAIELAALMP